MSEGEEEMPWEREDFIPMTKTGKQKSPNQIRSEIQRYIDNSGRTQTSVVNELGVNSNSFGRFMNPKTYKDQWSAVQNGTYWAAARFLAKEQHEKKKRPKKRAAEDSASSPNKKSKQEGQDLLDRIVNYETTEDVTTVFDTCPQLVAKIKKFLKDENVTKAAFCRALGGLNNNSLARFMAGKKQDQAGSVTYPRAYTFFEKQRLMNGAQKTKARLKNEEENPNGFELKSPRAQYYIVPRGYMGIIPGF